MFSYGGYEYATHSFSPNINLVNNSLKEAFRNNSFANGSSRMMRIYNLDKITAPVDISYLCANCYNFNQNIKLPPNFQNGVRAFDNCYDLHMPFILENKYIDNIYCMLNQCYNLTDIIINNCYINNAAELYAWTGSSWDTEINVYHGNDIYITDSNILNAYGMFQYAQHMNANFYIKNCIIQNAYSLLADSTGKSNEIIIDNTLLYDAYQLCAYTYMNYPESNFSKHFEINITTRSLSYAFQSYGNNSKILYINNSNFYFESIRRIDLQHTFSECKGWYLQNTNFYIGDNGSASGLAEFGWAENCNFTLGNNYNIGRSWCFYGIGNSGIVKNCNFNFGNDYNYYGESFWGTALIDNCNFNFGNNYNYIYKVFDWDFAESLTLQNLNVNFGNNYNKFDWSVIDAPYIIDCNFNIGSNYNNIYDSLDANHIVNSNFIIGNNINYIYYLFSAHPNLAGDFYLKIGDNIGNIYKLVDSWYVGENNTFVNSFCVILGNNINTLYGGIYLFNSNSRNNDALNIRHGQIIIGNNINKINNELLLCNNCSNFNIYIGHNINSIGINGSSKVIKYLGNNSKVFIGNNINFLGNFLSLSDGTYYNQDYSLNNIGTIEYTFLTLNHSSLYSGELKFSNVNFINGLIEDGTYNGNIYLNDTNTINGLIYNVNWINGNLYLNNINYINGLLNRCSTFNQNIILPNTLQTFSQAFISCYNFNQDITIPYNVTSMYRTFAGCEKFKNKNINILSSNVSNMQNMIINLIPNKNNGNYIKDDSYYSDYGGLRIYVPKNSLTNDTAHNTLNFNSIWTYNNSNNCYYHNNLFVYYI